MSPKANVIPIRSIRRKVQRQGHLASWTSDQWLRFDLASLVIDDCEYVEIDVMTDSWIGRRGRARARKLCHITTTREELQQMLAAIKPGRRLSTIRRS